MTRYRIEVWRTDTNATVIRKHINENCKLCAVKKAVIMANGYRTGMHLPEDTVRWSLSGLYGHLNGWMILHHSGQPIAGLGFRHGH